MCVTGMCYVHKLPAITLESIVDASYTNTGPASYILFGLTLILMRLRQTLIIAMPNFFLSRSAEG
jgi:hypothetical protein